MVQYESYDRAALPRPICRARNRVLPARQLLLCKEFNNWLPASRSLLSTLCEVEMSLKYFIAVLRLPNLNASDIVPCNRNFGLYIGYKFDNVNRVCWDDVTTGTEVQDRGECLGLYRCLLIIFRLK